MRLWHKDLIQYLPDLQLKGQWRECCNATNLAGNFHASCMNLLPYFIKIFKIYVDIL